MWQRFKENIYSQNIPVGNYGVIILAIVCFGIQMYCDPEQRHLSGLILRRFSFWAILGYMWLHMSSIHFLGNLITLWIFGRYVSLKMGGAKYFLSYVFLGYVAAVFHLIYDGRPTIGASGAIMGILGMHMVLCFKNFGIFGPWLILVWFILNLIAGIIGDLSITYMAHFGGFLAGVVLANVFILFEIVKSEDVDQELVQILRPGLINNHHEQVLVCPNEKTMAVNKPVTIAADNTI